MSSDSTGVRLRFFSVRVAVQTDVPEVDRFCRDLFARFVDTGNGDGSAPIELTIQSDGPERWKVRDPIIDARVENPAWLTGIAAARLLEMAGNEVLDHDLFHGAALAHGDRGLIISGESGFGKSVLTLSLLNRGWNFLSDEVAAIDGEGRLTPFPKALELREQAARVSGISISGPQRRSGKTLHDAEELFPGCLGAPCKPRAVVFLEAQEPAAEARRREVLELIVQHREPELIPELEALEGVKSAGWTTGDDGFPHLVIHNDPKRFVAWRVDELLGRHGVMVMGSSAEEAPPGDFSREPRLEPIDRAQGIGQLLTRFRGRRALARRIESEGGNFTQLFLTLVDRFDGVQFYRLRVGRLAAALDLIEDAVG